MSNCINNCKLCRNLILSTAVNFDGTNLIVALPDRAYNNGNKYCIVIAQSIPDSATINAPVVFTIGTGTTRYSFVNKCCEPIVASQVRTRTRYTTIVNTSVNTGVFKYIGNCIIPNTTNELESLPIAETAVTS